VQLCSRNAPQHLAGCGIELVGGAIEFGVCERSDGGCNPLRNSSQMASVSTRWAQNPSAMASKIVV